VIPRIAELIAQEEGYGIPGALPTRDHNPGDLRHSPHSFHSPTNPNAIGQIDDPQDGWDDLVGQLNDYVRDNPQITVSEAIYKWAPPTENDSAAYVSYVVSGLSCTEDTLLADALQIPGIGAYSDEPQGVSNG
jgi:hypothetical protein